MFNRAAGRDISPVAADGSTNQISMADDKKATGHFESPPGDGNVSDPEKTGEVVAFSNVDEKKVLRKMDIRLIPMLALLYLLSFLDRGNIANAKLEGLTEELGISGPQYNWCCRSFLSHAIFVYYLRGS